MRRPGLYVSVPDKELRWELKRAAVNERCTVAELVVRILTDWLQVRGYRTGAASGEAEQRGG